MVQYIIRSSQRDYITIAAVFRRFTCQFLTVTVFDASTHVTACTPACACVCVRTREDVGTMVVFSRRSDGLAPVRALSGASLMFFLL